LTKGMCAPKGILMIDLATNDGADATVYR
jgi:hypothetical protein